MKHRSSKPWNRVTACALLLLAATAAAPSAKAAIAQPCVYNNSRILNVWKAANTDRHMVIVIAHRGWWGPHEGIANTCGAGRSGPSLYPENSAEAVTLAFKNGFEAVEVDIKMTKDGIPILMHDRTLGRTTDIYTVYGPKYDPYKNVGYNPYVNSVNWYGNLDHRHLLSPNRAESSGSPVPAFAQLLDTYRESASSGIIVLDVKDRDSMKAVWQLMNNHADAHGSLARNWVAVKFNASTYPNPADLEADLYTHANPHTDNHQEAFLGIPVLTNNMLDKFGNLTDIEKSYMSKDYTLGVEVNLNTRNGRLQNAYNLVGQYREAVGIFNPLADGGAWSGTGEDQAFFQNTGQCCYRLSSVRYGDSRVDRWNWSFLYGNNWKSFDFITTDEPGKMINDLKAKGLRASEKEMM